ncbi:MAG: tetratricopeptide repeat protein [Rhodothermales bacterium]|nr:tetratricopeptide repeat protein [Rhodothermales bacterium]
MRVCSWIPAALLVLAACGGDADAPPAAPHTAEIAFENVAEASDFVGDAACADCHEDQWRGYQAHGMAQSFYPLTPENAVEDFAAPPLRHAASGLTYRVFEEDGAYFQEEYREAADGRITHRLVRRMDFVVGSGHAARTYLTEQGGRLHEMPLTWYTQQGRWDFSPGYAVANKRFDRLVPDRCMACHNSYPESVPFAEGKYAEVPHGIGCERCHGPGGLHVEARLAEPEAPDSIDPTIVNPAHLALERQLDVCQQCHLHGTVSVLREGRTPFGYRPSQDLADYVAFFSTDEEEAGTVGVISHADRMKQSACFLATQGTPEAMTCLTCHDPHEGFREAGPAYFNATCRSCHAPEALAERLPAPARADHGAEADCAACPVPSGEAAEAPHSSFTDHLIRVVEAVPALPAPAPAHGPPVLDPYYARDAGDDPEAQRYRGMAYLVLAEQRADTAAYARGIDLLETALSAAPDHGEAQFLLGRAHLLLGRPAQALPPLEASVRLDPGIPERLNTLAQAYEAAGRDPAVIERLYQRALAIQPALADVRVNYGRFLETQGRLPEALAQYRAAAAEQPWLAAAHFNLGTAHLRQGAAEEGEAALRRAVELAPDHVRALSNLGLLYAMQGREQDARAFFERAIAAGPDDPVALGNLGTYHLNAGDLGRAIALLRRAVEADPAYLDGLLNLALAHFRAEDYEQAAVYARRALAVDPANARARQILAAL